MDGKRKKVELVAGGWEWRGGLEADLLLACQVGDLAGVNLDLDLDY